MHIFVAVMCFRWQTEILDVFVFIVSWNVKSSFPSSNDRLAILRLHLSRVLMKLMLGFHLLWP